MNSWIDRRQMGFYFFIFLFLFFTGGDKVRFTYHSINVDIIHRNSLWKW